MNPILFTFFLIFSITFHLSNADESLFLTPAVKANITQFRYYECNSESEVTQVQASARYESDTLSCNVFNFENLNTTYAIKLGNDSHELDLSINSYTVSLNGNSIFMRNARIEEGPCAGGHIDELTFGLADDQNGCHGRGLAQITPVYSILRISGGKCQAECSGGVTTMYDPPLINTSEEISFKACDNQ